MLTDLQIKALPPTGQPYRVPDGSGLFIAIAGYGERSWVFRYKLRGASGSIGLGSYPAVGLKVARALAEQARAQVAAGIKPVGLRAQERARDARSSDASMAAMVWAWFESEQTRWSAQFRREVQHRLQQEVIKPIGAMPAADVTMKILLEQVLEPLKARSHDIAQRVRQHLDHAFAYGIAKELTTTNPAAMARTSLGRKPPGGFRPALIELPAVRTMLAQVEALPAFPQVKLANRFMALTAMRPGEVRFARWEEFEAVGVWRIPAARMKMQGRGDHLVPVSRQAVDVLREAQARFGRQPYLFPHATKSQQALSESAVGHFINRAGYAGRHSAHGWRSAFSTVMNDHNPADADIIEAALAHQKQDQVAGRYNRGTYFERRRVLMQTWADLLLDGMPDATTICAGRKRSPLIVSPIGHAA